MPNFLNSSGFSNDNSIASLISLICSSRPPRSEYLTFGFSIISAPETNGSNASSNTSITANVS